MAPTASVQFDVCCSSTLAIGYSPIIPINAKINTIAKIGNDVGSIIIQNVCHALAPSIEADSSSETGNESKYPLIIQICVATPPKYAKISPGCVSNPSAGTHRPMPSKIEYTAINASTIGNICSTSNPPSNRSRPQNRIRANAYAHVEESNKISPALIPDTWIEFQNQRNTGAPDFTQDPSPCCTGNPNTIRQCSQLNVSGVSQILPVEKFPFRNEIETTMTSGNITNAMNPHSNA